MIAVSLIVLGLALNLAAWWSGQWLAGRLLGRGPSRRSRGARAATGAAAAYGVCALLAFLVEATVGEPTATTTVDVVPGSAAARAGLLDGDRIVNIDGQAIEHWEQIPAAVARGRPRTVNLTIDRAGQKLETSAELGASEKLGVFAQSAIEPVPLPSAAARALVYPGGVILGVAEAILSVADGSSARPVAGPVAILRSTGMQNRGSSVRLFMLVAALAWPTTLLLSIATYRRAQVSAETALTAPLASRGQRFWGGLLDSALYTLPFLVSRVTSSGGDAAPLNAAGAATMVLVLALEAVLISRYGRSVGKFAAGTMIVRGDGLPAGFLHGVLLRTWLLFPFRLVPLGNLLTSAIDYALIFRSSRRCLHDDVAHTAVVRTRADSGT